MRLNHPLLLILVSATAALALSAAVFSWVARNSGPATLTAVAGLEQSGRVGEALDRTVAVRLSDPRGRPAAGVPITFEVVAGGGGSADPPVAITGLDGIAESRWSLGYFSGEAQLLEARAVVPEREVELTATFRAVPLPGAPASLVKEPSLAREAPERRVPVQEIVVRVRDRYGNAVPGAEVTWTTEGGGLVAPTSAESDEAGLVRGLWRMGSGTQVAEAAAGAARASFTVFATGGEEALFFDNFEQGLGKWTDGPHRAHSAEILPDPVRPGNYALRFRRLGAGADLVSIPIPSVPGGTYRLRFDYRGTPTSEVPTDLGGYIGITDALRGRQLWLGGTNAARARTAVQDDGRWRTYTVPFSVADGLSPGEMRVMLEDFDQPGGVAGDAYFDNIAVLRSQPGG
jgi:hypothetical protein